MEMLKQHHLQAWQIKAERDNTQITPATRNHGHQHDGKEQNALADYCGGLAA